MVYSALPVLSERIHRSDRPAVWDHANPRAEPRVHLRKKLSARLPRRRR